MATRREFIKTTTLTGASIILNAPALINAHPSQRLDGYGIHPFIEANPESVFILRTNISSKTDSTAKREAGQRFASSVFIPKSQADGGFPFTWNVAIKPNLTDRNTRDADYDHERCMGIITDSDFVEGVIESLKTTGVPAHQIYMREVNGPEDFTEGGYTAMAQRTGAHLDDLSAAVGDIDDEWLVWKDVENGVWFRQIPYLWPINAENSLLLNIAKFKAHGMGLTLCAKNLQGSIAHHYQAHCTSYYYDMNIHSADIQDGAKQTILDNYRRHKADGIPRWDRPGSTGGLWMETWATRCLDNNTATRPHLHIIEGIYGRDGNFIHGPSSQGLATDYLTNIIIFGKNAFHVDIVGHWLGGHEPGNFGLFHMARERGLSTLLNPADIPVFEWHTQGEAVRTDLSEFDRTPLKTYYLRRDYNNQSEPYWHLCDEPYNYSSSAISPPSPARPEAFILHQNYPNPFNPSTSIAFSLPRAGRARLEIINLLGEVVARPADDFFAPGHHMVSWNSGRHPSGSYFYRLTFEGYQQTQKMTLVR